MHRWTATAINHLEPDLTAHAHHRAARYWRWRVQVLPQSEHDDLDDLIEVRHHHHAAGEHDAALQLSDHAIVQLQTWGQHGHASELCRQTLDWVPPDTAKAAGYIHQLGVLAQDRGDDDTAEQRYTQSLEINERLGNQAGLANSCATLAVLMADRDDEQAISYDLRALAIRTQMRDERATFRLQRLAPARSRLGATAFMRIATQSLDDASLEALNELLDQEEPPPVELPRRRRWWHGRGRGAHAS